MSAYVIGYLTVRDWERYRAYGARFFRPFDVQAVLGEGDLVECEQNCDQ
jgi:hypothetical protein